MVKPKGGSATSGRFHTRDGEKKEQVLVEVCVCGGAEAGGEEEWALVEGGAAWIGRSGLGAAEAVILNPKP